jgi:hypothetical protein
MRAVGVAAYSLTVLLTLWCDVAGADHGPGVPIRSYASKNADEAAILRLIRTVAEDGSRRTWSASCRPTLLTRYSARGTRRRG